MGFLCFIVYSADEKNQACVQRQFFSCKRTERIQIRKMVLSRKIRILLFWSKENIMESADKRLGEKNHGTRGDCRETVEMAAKIQDRAQRVFALAGILAFTDKVIDRETANRIRRAIEMTQVAMIFEEEKQQAVKQAVERTVEAERKRALDADKQVVMKMIERGYSTEEIVFLMSGYSRNEVERLREQLQNAKEPFN